MRQSNFYSLKCGKFVFYLCIQFTVKRFKHRFHIMWFKISVWSSKAVKLNKNANPDKVGYIGLGIGFDVCSQFSLLNDNLDKNVIIFGVGNSLSSHTDSWKKDDTKILVETKYFINITNHLVLILPTIQATFFLHANDVKLYQFKAKHLEIKPYLLRNIHYPLGNISKRLYSR